MSMPFIDLAEKVAEITRVLDQKPKTGSEISSKIAYLEVWGQWVHRIKHDRDNLAIPTQDLDSLLVRMNKEKTELEKVLPNIRKREQLDRLLTLVKPIYPFLSLDCNERLEAHISFPCGHNATIPLLEHIPISSLEALLEGRVDSIGFGVGCSKCHKSSLSVRLYVDPKKVVDLARQGKIKVI